MTLSQLKQKRIGLVLSGGGAKGAYQIGCWRALRKHGVTDFAAIAGTSVGAVNAALIAAGQPEAAESAWTGLRWSEVVELRPAELVFLPFWILAYLVSEFSPLKILRISGSMTHPNPAKRWHIPASVLGIACVVFTVGGFVLSRTDQVATWTLWTAAVVGIVALTHNASRWALLRPMFTTTGPLAHRLKNAITEEGFETIRRARIPVYATLSRFRPYTEDAVRWGGWVPHYVRIDRLHRKAALDILLKGTGFPGMLATRVDPNNAVVDGGWTDNIPVAPLLFEPGTAVDIMFVINTSRFRPDLDRDDLLGKLLPGRYRPQESDGQGTLRKWAELRWRAHDKQDLPIQRRPFPQVVSIVPSRPLGHFYTGTCWFSQKKIREMMKLGEKDMTETLAQLGGTMNTDATEHVHSAALCEAD